MTKVNLQQFYPVLSMQALDEIFNDFLPAWDHNLKTDDSFPKTAQRIENNILTYQLALAGYSRDKLSIEAGLDYIIVKGDKAEATLLAGRAFTWTRRDVSGIWDFQKAEIIHENGMLTIFIPKREEAKPKVLQIR